MSKPLDNSGRRSEVRPAEGLASEMAQTGLVDIFHDFHDFLVHQKNIENLTSRRILQKLKNTSPGHPNLDFKMIWYPFGINFIYISQLPENLYFATCIMRNACFCFSSPAMLVSLFKSNVFPRHVPGHPFSWFYVDFMRNGSIWAPLPNLVGAKMGSKIDHVAP